MQQTCRQEISCIRKRGLALGLLSFGVLGSLIALKLHGVEGPGFWMLGLSLGSWDSRAVILLSAFAWRSFIFTPDCILTKWRIGYCTSTSSEKKHRLEGFVPRSSPVRPVIEKACCWVWSMFLKAACCGMCPLVVAGALAESLCFSRSIPPHILGIGSHPTWVLIMKAP